MQPFEVIKATGEREKFKLSKLKRSLTNAGAQPTVIKTVINNLEGQGYFRDGITTKKIYSEAYRLLKMKSKRVAGRYKLKESLLELGPSGYPFEILVSEVFKVLGYQTEVGKIIQGKCVTHEIDVIAKEGREILIMECKFHNRKGHHCNVTIPLYVQSRFLDVAENGNSSLETNKHDMLGYVVTNTRFTQDAIDYANCKNLKLLSWNYPEHRGLRTLLEETKIHPITALSTLTKKEKKAMLDKKIVHCQQLLKHEVVLDELHFSHVKKTSILKEAKDFCSA